ncbi:MAG TPA: Rrf2 family transcriptional regulator [Pirellulales bacterium]|nr:Rrf2 family transcriptional regulator [Pirellulales bacterium]
MSRTVMYAVQAALQLAQSDGSRPIPCSQIANQGQMPERFLLQILRSLVTHGILHSTRGVDGGYGLDRSPAEISLLDIIEAVEGPLVSLPLEGGSEELQIRLNDAVCGVNALVSRELGSIKLSHLLAPAVVNNSEPQLIASERVLTN